MGTNAHDDCELPPSGNASEDLHPPYAMPEVLRFIDALSTVPGVEQPVLGAEWTALRKLCADKVLDADDVPDAGLAATAIYEGEHLVSLDADFKRLLSRAQFTRLTV